MKTVEAESFTNFGPTLFNCLPRAIRDMTRCTMEAFKRRLNKFLGNIPDEPHCPSLQNTASNSTVDQMQYMST